MASTTKIYIDGNTYPVKDQLRKLGVPMGRAPGRHGTPNLTKWPHRPKRFWDRIRFTTRLSPADLGTVDPISLAATHGRKARDGARVVSFSCTGLPKGDDGLPNGAIRRVKGLRYVQVARTKRQYLSRDYLDDMDMFDSEPGGSYQWDGVAVEDTPDESAADQKSQAERDAKAAAPKAWAAVVAKIDQIVADRPAWVNDSTRVATWGKPVMIHTGSYPSIYLSDSEVYYHVPSYFACDWDYAAVHRARATTGRSSE